MIFLIAGAIENIKALTHTKTKLLLESKYMCCVGPAVIYTKYCRL